LELFFFEGFLADFVLKDFVSSSSPSLGLALNSGLSFSVFGYLCFVFAKTSLGFFGFSLFHVNELLIHLEIT
jgi:hypothetical protein